MIRRPLDFPRKICGCSKALSEIGQVPVAAASDRHPGFFVVCDFSFLPGESILLFATCMKNTAFALIFVVSVSAARAAPPSDESILKMMNALHLQATLDQLVAQLD